MANRKNSDPTSNVLSLVSASMKRTDDLHQAEVRRTDDLNALTALRLSDQISAERIRVNEQLALRAEYSEKLAVAEAKRIDAIRSVDVSAVAIANERATAQAVVLANQVAVSAETLRSLVAATADTMAQQQTANSTQLSNRITSLEKSQYESKGSSGGMRDMWGWVFGIGIALVGTAAAVIMALK